MDKNFKGPSTFGLDMMWLDIRWRYLTMPSYDNSWQSTSVSESVLIELSAGCRIDTTFDSPHNFSAVELAVAILRLSICVRQIIRVW